MRAALYARFSTDKQREASITDQLRVAGRLAAEHGFEVVATFSDAAISGGTQSRPGYQQLLKAARERDFEAIVVEDSSRLWRNNAEQQQRLAELHDLGVSVIGRDLDTRAEGSHFVSGIFGAANEHFRREIGRKTYRGQEGNAIAHRSTGGRAFGYIPACDSGTSQVEINQEEAAIVRRIFQMYADGASPRTIAGRFNIEGVPSPGSSWDRKKRRTDRKWLASAIHGDPKRGSGILNNPRYVGRVIWGRMKWNRSYRDSAKRTPQLLAKPAQEYQDERLRIVPQELWAAVRTRQEMRSAEIGVRIKDGRKRHAAERTNSSGAGVPPRYLLSGLLHCGLCEASFVLSNGSRYQCASHVNGRACNNRISVKRELVQKRIVDSIREDLTDPDTIAEVEKMVRHAIRNKPRSTEKDKQRIEQLRREVANLTDAIAQGLLRTSGSIAQRLVAAESELQRMDSAAKPAKVTQLVPNVRERFLALVDRLDSLIAPRQSPKTADRRADHVAELGRVEGARAAITNNYGPRPISLMPDESGKFLWAEFGLEPLALRAVSGGSEIMVAGVGFEPTTFGL